MPGICRRCQLTDLAFGGILYQDIAAEVPEAINHVNTTCDSHRYPISFPKESSLAVLP